MDLTNEAMRRLSLARAQVARQLAYFNGITMGFRVVMQPGLGTVATTDDLVFLADPEVITQQWPTDTHAGAFTHEVLHHYLNHPARGRRMREAEGTDFDPYLWNVAADFECNRIVKEVGFKLPDGALFAAGHKLPDNVLAEVAYRELRKRKEESEPQDAKNQPDVGGQGQDQQSRGGFAAGRCGSCAGGQPTAGEERAPAEARASTMERQTIVRAAAEAAADAAAKRRGTVPDEIARAAEKGLEAATVPWQRVLAAHLHRAVDRRRGYRDFTYARPSRRQSAMGAGPGRPLLPSTFEPVIEVAVVVDTSGSMGQQELQVALSEIDGLLRASPTALRVMSCDAKVHATGKVNRVSEVAKLLKGGGGTDFRPAFEALRPHRPGVTIFVTDGYGPAPETQPAWTDTIWLLVGRHTRVPQAGDSWHDVDWGQVLRAGEA